MSRPPVIWWVRRDLRLGDNPALNAAASAGPVLPVFVLDPFLWDASGDPRRAFLAGTLEHLGSDTGGHLVVRRGDPAEQLAAVAEGVGARLVMAAVDFGPYAVRRDQAVEKRLGDAGIELRWVGSPYAVAPGTLGPYKVYSAFARAWTAHGWDQPVPRPTRVPWAEGVDGVGIPPAPALGASLPTPGEAAGLRRWRHFADGDLAAYGKERNDPGANRTSRLSPYLHFGCLHPRTLLTRAAGSWRNELCWREFYADVLYRQPASARSSLQAHMAGMRLDEGPEADRRFDAWREGRTGYPIVDAGMRQLRAEAWMHNRVRMITASFLVKDLHIDWVRGARWFMRSLVDGDLASNQHGWQWVAGTGTDAAPYFRVFNPVLQGRKFDPRGQYVRRWIPELAGVDDRWVHAPWEAPGGQLPLDAGGYPDPIVDHAVERDEALARYAEARGRDAAPRAGRRPRSSGWPESRPQG